MSHIHRPGNNRWICAICHAPADQQHHIDYRAPNNWALIPLCNRHHTHLHKVHDRVREDQPISIAVVSARYLLDPDATRALAITGDPYAQLSFADQATPHGHYWRRWVDSQEAKAAVGSVEEHEQREQREQRDQRAA